MKISNKTELTASIHHIDRFSKLLMLIYNPEVPEKSENRQLKSRTLFSQTQKVHAVRIHLFFINNPFLTLAPKIV